MFATLMGRDGPKSLADVGSGTGSLEIGLAYRAYYTHDGVGHEEISRLAACWT